MTDTDRSSSGLTRRSLLAGATAGLTATSGCIGRLRTLAGRQEAGPLSLSVKTLPVDEDPFAIAIARQLAAWFDTAGIGTNVQPMTAESLYRQTLVDQEFDVFVAQYPIGRFVPDTFYQLLHSKFSVEPGLQNPFGYANLTADELLETQRRTTGQRRRTAVAKIQRRLAQDCPFVVVGRPDAIRAVRTDRFDGWAGAFDPSPLQLLSVDRVDPGAETLRATTSDPRPMANLNPLTAAFRTDRPVTTLLYDSLARRFDGELHPWAATEVTWRPTASPTLRVTLRDGLRWHDGQPVTVADVLFTYEFLTDTSLGRFDQPAPPTRFRGRASLVDDAVPIDYRTVDIRLQECSRPVAERALTLPLLPEHVWRDRTEQANVSGIEVGSQTTEAQVTDAIPPVGSGPLRFESTAQRGTLRLERFEDHFLVDDADEQATADTAVARPRGQPAPTAADGTPTATTSAPATAESGDHGERLTAPGLPPALTGGVPFEGFELRFVGSDDAAVELVADGQADVTAAGVGPDLVPTIGRATDLELSIDRTDAFYLIGFNARRSPLSNPRFRRLCSRLVDRDALVESVFSGFARPAVTPLADSRWVPADLRWTGEDPVTPFLGSRGHLDRDRVRTAFRDAGYQYGDRGRLLQA